MVKKSVKDSDIAKKNHKRGGRTGESELVASFKNIGYLRSYGEASYLTRQHKELGRTSTCKRAIGINQEPTDKGVTI